MTYLLIGLGVIAGLIVTVIIVGLLMPQRFEGRVQALLDKTPGEVWDALLDYDAHPMTGKMKKTVEALPEDQSTGALPAWIEDMGRGERITVRTVEAVRPERMIREMQAAAMPMSSRWTYTFEEAGNGCKLTLTGETHIRSGGLMAPIFRVMMVIGGGVRKGLSIQIEMVARTLGVTASYES